jgi:hypothetical protein
MSETKAPRTGYEITVKGQYYAHQGRDKFLKTYGPLKFYIPDVVEIVTGRKMVDTVVDGRVVKRSVPVRSRMNGARVAQHYIQRNLLQDALKEAHPDSSGFRTCVIVDSKRVNLPDDLKELEEVPIKQMTLNQLRRFCSLNSLSVPIDAFTDINDARQAVSDEYESQQMAQKRNNPTAHLQPADVDPTTVAPQTEGQAPTHDGSGNPVPAGVKVGDGPVSSPDNVPTDEEDPLKNLL